MRTLDSKLIIQEIFSSLWHVTFTGPHRSEILTVNLSLLSWTRLTCYGNIFITNLFFTLWVLGTRSKWYFLIHLDPRSSLGSSHVVYVFIPLSSRLPLPLFCDLSFVVSDLYFCSATRRSPGRYKLVESWEDTAFLVSVTEVYPILFSWPGTDSRVPSVFRPPTKNRFSRR